MSDREDIYDLMVRYGRGLDTNDIELLKTCFTEDAVVDFTEVVNKKVSGWKDISEFYRNGLQPMEGAHHFSNFTFDIDTDKGAYSCYLIVYHWPRGTEPTPETLFSAGTCYRNRVVRTEAGWRICFASQKWMWRSGAASVIQHFEGSNS